MKEVFPLPGKHKISVISSLHYVQLVFRSALLLAAAVVYLTVRDADRMFESYKPFYLFLWLSYAVGMLLRFFPSPVESMGCQKQFARNFKPADPGAKIIAHPRRFGVLYVALAWLALNGLIGAAHLMGWIDKGAMLLISLFYGVCDMICILFFCPFQTWFMRNKCCTTCRIYNWDYAMMFTPLVFTGGWWSWSLVIMALMLLIRWEVTAHRHPERFSEACNGSLACKNCQEKLCSHKKQLQGFLREMRR